MAALCFPLIFPNEIRFCKLNYIHNRQNMIQDSQFESLNQSYSSKSNCRQSVLIRTFSAIYSGSNLSNSRLQEGEVHQNCSQWGNNKLFNLLVLPVSSLYYFCLPSALRLLFLQHSGLYFLHYVDSFLSKELRSAFSFFSLLPQSCQLSLSNFSYQRTRT